MVGLPKSGEKVKWRGYLPTIGDALSETGQMIKTSNDGYPRLEDKIAGYQQEESRETLEDDTSNDQKSDEQGTSASPSCWLQDFEQQQQQIIRLWDSCYSSIGHRSYFFMLFTEANPSDSIYMEVELRRLSFIQSKFSQGAKIKMDGQILTFFKHEGSES